MNHHLPVIDEGPTCVNESTMNLFLTFNFDSSIFLSFHKVMTVLSRTEGERLTLLGPAWVPRFEAIAGLIPPGRTLKI